VITTVLAFLVGVFFLSSGVIAGEIPKNDDIGYFVGFDGNADATGKNGPGGSDGGDDGDADPDWWQTTSWNQAQMTKGDATRVEVPRTLVVPLVPAIGPYAQLVNWLLGHIGNTYISMWR
jgi:hypothetical protein